jgi:hypothetical protein
VDGNRDGVGARVRLDLDGHPWTDEVRAGSSYLSQNEITLYVGLGSSESAESVSIRWPSGRSETVGWLQAGRVYVVKEGLGVIR